MILYIDLYNCFIFFNNFKLSMIVKEILFVRMNMIPKNKILSIFLMMNNIFCINFNAEDF